MMLLGIKALVYQKTGIYLAYKEELEYVTSKEFWKSYVKLSKKRSLDLTGRNLQGLLIGLWQAKNGFYRSF